MTQNHVIFFNSYLFLRWWAPCRQEVWIFQLSVGVKHPWSRVNRCHLLLSFPVIAFHFAFISSMFLSCRIHVLSFCFHVLSCSVAMYQRYRWSSKAYTLKPVRWVSAQTLAFFFIFCYCCYRLAIVFGGLCRLPSSGVMNMCIYIYIYISWTCAYISSLSFCFTLIVFWAGNALAVLRCNPS